ncbi:MAG TPA: nucleotide disphospho-sugar-binding domain-containing protein [Tepidisphaeraceae bacterium]|nr:nucleotide disphospho-sugar-binding domain-containing protein [Tepidisphaeraceae bacterium]
MNIFLFTIGSHGDVHPFVGLGLSLRDRGHDVTLITNGHFSGLAAKAGLQFVELGTDEQFRTLMDDPDLWHPTRGFDAVFMRGVMPSLEQAYQTIADRYVPEKTVVVASSLGLGARIAQEKFNIPTATVHIQPAVIRTVYDNPKLPGLFMPRWFPKWFKRKMWQFGDRVLIDRKLAKPINEFRAKVGLTQPVSGILKDWWNSPQLMLGLWPDWYAPMQPDWPPQLRLVGFPLYDETGIVGISDDLNQWLGAGDAPIAFTPGSAMIQGASFFADSVQACLNLKRRGILLTRHADQIPKDLPPSVKHVDYVPFKLLLPRCAALVHHGGIGTNAQALAAGVPQLITPMAHDQFDNAQRIGRLSVGRSINFRRYNANSATALLSEILTSPLACKTVARRFEGQMALERASDLIENLYSSQVPVNK